MSQILSTYYNQPNAVSTQNIIFKYYQHLLSTTAVSTTIYFLLLSALTHLDRENIKFNLKHIINETIVFLIHYWYSMITLQSDRMLQNYSDESSF